MLNSFRPSKSGLEKFLGPLEVRVMLTLWRGKKTARAIYRHITLAEDEDYAVTTIRAIIDRLVKKGLIYRRKVEGVYHYTPRFATEGDFIEAAIREILLSLIEDYPRQLRLMIKAQREEAK